LLFFSSDLNVSDNHKAFVNKELESATKSWAGSPMESAFAAVLRNLTLLQRDQISKTAKILISSWKVLDLADELVGIGAVSSSNQNSEQHEQLFNVIKLGLARLSTVCCHKVLSLLTAVLFEEFAFAMLKVLLNLSEEARQDVQIISEDGSDEHFLGGNLMGFAAKERDSRKFPIINLWVTLIIFQVHAAGLALGSYAKQAAVTTFMGDTLAKTLQTRSKASLAILDQVLEIFLMHLSKFESSSVLIHDLLVIFCHRSLANFCVTCRKGFALGY
jgi:hypothetical protein